MKKKIEDGPLGDFKNHRKKILEMRFLNSVTLPKNVKGDALGFFDIHCVAKYRNQRRGDPLVESKRNFKKSYIVPKKIRVKNTEGGSYVFEVLNVYVFVLDEVLAFRVCFGRP